MQEWVLIKMATSIYASISIKQTPCSDGVEHAIQMKQKHQGNSLLQLTTDMKGIPKIQPPHGSQGGSLPIPGLATSNTRHVLHKEIVSREKGLNKSYPFDLPTPSCYWDSCL
jgi:hypothetical protein